MDQHDLAECRSSTNPSAVRASEAMGVMEFMISWLMTRTISSHAESSLASSSLWISCNETTERYAKYGADHLGGAAQAVDDYFLDLEIELGFDLSDHEFWPEMPQ